MISVFLSMIGQNIMLITLSPKILFVFFYSSIQKSACLSHISHFALLTNQFIYHTTFIKSIQTWKIWKGLSLRGWSLFCLFIFGMLMIVYCVLLVGRKSSPVQTDGSSKSMECYGVVQNSKWLFNWTLLFGRKSWQTHLLGVEGAYSINLKTDLVKYNGCYDSMMVYI